MFSSWKSLWARVNLLSTRLLTTLILYLYGWYEWKFRKRANYVGLWHQLSFYSVSISDVQNIKKPYFPFRFLFYSKLNFVIVAIKDVFDCVDLIKGDRCYNVVCISEIKRRLKGERRYTLWFQVIYENICGYGAQWWALRKAKFCSKEVPWKLNVELIEKVDFDSNLSICEKWNCIKWNYFVAWTVYKIFHFFDKFKNIFYTWNRSCYVIWNNFVIEGSKTVRWTHTKRNDKSKGTIRFVYFG